jgi:uncharacterized protein involved in exopolysaccharide biosynthesis
MPEPSTRPLRSAIEAPAETRQSADNLPFVWAFEVLRRRYRTIAFSTIIACAFALVYILLATPYYTASTWLMTDTRRSSSPSVLGDVAVDPAVVESQIETVRSQKIALAVINRLNLQNDPEFVGPNLLARVLESLGFRGKNYESPAAIQRRILDSFERKLKVSQISRSYVAEIQFTSINPRRRHAWQMPLQTATSTINSRPVPPGQPGQQLGSSSVSMTCADRRAKPGKRWTNSSARTA